MNLTSFILAGEIEDTPDTASRLGQGAPGFIQKPETPNRSGVVLHVPVAHGPIHFGRCKKAQSTKCGPGHFLMVTIALC